MLSNIDIQNIIPHRYPFLLIDKVVEVEPGKKAVAIKNVTANEPFFQGHFPGYPIMPGVLIVEALAQTACVAGLMLEENKGKLGFFTGIESMKFRKQVHPGDTLKLEAEFLVFKMGMGKVKVVATVDGAVAAQGEIKFAIVDPKKD
ncbi:UNVERIFIED_CONTAM: 3-hydroxyacyl-[acyl-carrier-protein] dehydratase [Acetivibrio alkalicellulosi]